MCLAFICVSVDHCSTPPDAFCRFFPSREYVEQLLLHVKILITLFCFPPTRTVGQVKNSSRIPVIFTVEPPKASSGVLRVSPLAGFLLGNQTAKLEVVFAPRETKRYRFKLPIKVRHRAVAQQILNDMPAAKDSCNLPAIRYCRLLRRILIEYLRWKDTPLSLRFFLPFQMSLGSTVERPWADIQLLGGSQ